MQIMSKFQNLMDPECTFRAQTVWSRCEQQTMASETFVFWIDLQPIGTKVENKNVIGKLSSFFSCLVKRD